VNANGRAEPIVEHWMGLASILGDDAAEDENETETDDDV
jgi:hypothetical protein